VHGEQPGNAAALLEHFADAVARPLGATIVTSTSFGGTMQLKRMLKPCANISILPAVRPGLMSFSYTLA
jgi:hypothetical protein